MSFRIKWICASILQCRIHRSSGQKIDELHTIWEHWGHYWVCAWSHWKPIYSYQGDLPSFLHFCFNALWRIDKQHIRSQSWRQFLRCQKQPDEGQSQPESRGRPGWWAWSLRWGTGSGSSTGSTGTSSGSPLSSVPGSSRFVIKRGWSNRIFQRE